jgi:hypothetical protein
VTYLDEIAQALRAEVPSDVLPVDGDLDQLFRLYALLVRAKGATTTPSDVHDAWSAWMVDSGQAHESITPYEHLDGETKQADEPFLRAIHTVALGR